MKTMSEWGRDGGEAAGIRNDIQMLLFLKLCLLLLFVACVVFFNRPLPVWL